MNLGGSKVTQEELEYGEGRGELCKHSAYV